MKYLLLLPCIFFAASVSGQNILSNSNFAEYNACPWSGSQMDYCKFWYQATLATPDYYNACAATGSMPDVPKSSIGYQVSNSNAYAGVYTYCGALASGVVPDYKEYFRTSFPPLHIGATYKVTMTVSLADSAFYASDGLGVYFSKGPVNKYTLTTITKTPQIDYSSYGVLTDKVNWVTLTKNFIADSAYTDLVIGNFKNNSTISLVLSPYHGHFTGPSDSTAYYFIDSVSVEKISSGVSTENISGSVLSLSPNPFSDLAILTFNNVAGEQYSMDIYSMDGRLVRRMSSISTGSVTIERGTLESGFYYYKLYNGTNTVANDKFIIR